MSITRHHAGTLPLDTTNVWKLLRFTATCFGVNNCTSPDHGSCKTTDICQCKPGYIGQLLVTFCGCFVVVNVVVVVVIVA